MFSDMDLSEKLDPRAEEEGEGSWRASKMFSSSVSSSVFLHILEEMDVPTTKYNDISCAPITLKAALGAAVHQSYVDLPEQDFDEDLMHMTASFQKQMSVSSVASEDDILLKGTSGHSTDSSFLLFDIDSLATPATTSNKKSQSNKEVPLDTTQDTNSSVSSSESTKVATNNKKKPKTHVEDTTAEDTTQENCAPFVFPDCELHVSEDENEEEKTNPADREHHEEEEEDVTIVGVVKGRAPSHPHNNTQISSPTPTPIKITGPIELNWITPSESKPATKIVNLKQVEDAASLAQGPVFNQPYDKYMQRGSPDLTGTSVSHNHEDSFSTFASEEEEEEERLQNYLYHHHHHHNPQTHCEKDYYHNQHQTHYPTEYPHDHHRRHSTGNWDVPKPHPRHTPIPSPCQCQDGELEFELPDEYILAAERLRESMARSRMSRTAVVRHNSSDSTTSSSRTANTGALLRERHLPQPCIRANNEMPSTTSHPPTLVTPAAYTTMNTPHHQHHHNSHYDTMNGPVPMEPEIRFLRTDGTPAFPQRFY